MNREKLKEIEARWTDYLAKSDAERKVLFELWWDKRDFWDLCEAVDKALDGDVLPCPFHSDGKHRCIGCGDIP